MRKIPNRWKIVITGECACGSSCLLERMACNSYNPSFSNTTSICCCCEREIYGKTKTIEIWDVKGLFILNMVWINKKI